MTFKCKKKNCKKSLYVCMRKLLFMRFNKANGSTAFKINK